MKRRVVVLRDAVAARSTCAALTAAGFDPVRRPLFTITAEPWVASPADAFDALLLTSANAPRHAGARLADYAGLPCYCVGTTTADAAGAARLTPALVGDARGAQALIDAAPGRRWLWLSGVVHSALTIAPPATLTIVPVYRSTAVDPPPVLDQTDAVLLVHSRAAAERLVALVSDRATRRVVAGSAAIAAALGGGWRTLTIAATPRDADMVAKARMLWQT
jgi:uroporphyrinogen-III synthase